MSTFQISYAQDSLVTITTTQLKQTNLLFNRLETLEKIDSIQLSIISSLEESNDVLSQQLHNHVEELNICAITNDMLQEDKNRLSRKLKQTRWALTINSLLLGCLLVILL